VRAATRGVLKVTTGARTCGTKAEGTGFVYAPQRVMTTAHTVSGSRDPVEVSIPSGGRRYQATVVLYDPRRDVAVLAVPGLRAPTLTFSPAGRSRAAAVIAGYPPHAAALDADDTAYALTAQELAPDAQAGRTAEKAVSTQGCSR
jgi:hypothetical protein